MKIKAIKHILDDNDKIAATNRTLFEQAGTVCFNLISSPGSGKTTLLEKTIAKLNEGKQKSAVIVGDLETARDAERVDSIAAESIQINTGLSCHLYANQIAAAIDDMELEDYDKIFIENVGNMVCPGEFDLGENLKVVLYSIPEGDDKVAKYPTIFRVADIVLITKSDLASVCDFDMEKVMADIRRLNSTVPVLTISFKTGENTDKWYEWLDSQRSVIGRAAGHYDG
ncbi:MAG: hydrogenase nickel incorporation protein HypB [Sedimentisphaeraceae bacterium JB056]